MNTYFIACIIFLIGLSPNHLSALNSSLGTVIFANVIYRHGDRTPVEPYLNDPYRNESLWPVPFGQLTNIGKHQHLMLGRWFRNRYDHLLQQSYSLYDIYVRSTDVDRTLMSAECNLAGLYPPQSAQVWDNKIKWMPIPVHTIPQKQDNILAGKKFCQRYNKEFERIKTTGDIERINMQNKQLYDYLTEKSGTAVNDLTDAEYLFNVLYIENLYNKTLPEWTKSVFPEKLQPLAEMSFELQAYNDVLKRLKVGPLIGEMVDHMVKKSKNALRPDRKVWMYSAHDDTIANVLMTLNLFERHLPPYTATILIELRLNSKNQHIVTISYKNSTEEPKLLTLPGCMVACPLYQFVKLTKPLIPENWEKECSLEFENHENEVVTDIVGILIASILTLIVLIALVIGYFYWHYTRYHQYHMRYLINVD